MRFLASALAVVALSPFFSSIQPLSPPVRAQVAGSWHAGCPVPLSGLRVLTVSYWGFDEQVHRGQLVVNAKWAPELAQVFRHLYELRFHIRRMALSDAYGPRSARSRDVDVTSSFECRQAVPSPVHWRHGNGQLVPARLRTGDRPEPGGEPLRRLRDDPRQESALLPRPLAAPARDGHARGRARLQVDRLGLGRRLVRLDEGLHALLGERTLTQTAGSRISAWSLSGG